MKEPVENITSLTRCVLFHHAFYSAYSWIERQMKEESQRKKERERERKKERVCAKENECRDRETKG